MASTKSAQETLQDMERHWKTITAQQKVVRKRDGQLAVEAFCAQYKPTPAQLALMLKKLEKGDAGTLLEAWNVVGAGAAGLAVHGKLSG